MLCVWCLLPLDPLHGGVALARGGGKAVVVPPVHDGGADGQAGGKVQ